MSNNSRIPDTGKCYSCEYRGTIPGDAHSCCRHPAYKDINSNPLLAMMGMFASAGRVDPICAKTEGIDVVGDPHGIRNGWFNHPFNFDPTWLVKCTGYKEKIK